MSEFLRVFKEINDIKRQFHSGDLTNEQLKAMQDRLEEMKRELLLKLDEKPKLPRLS